MAENFYTILTDTGKAKLANAQALGTKVEFSEMAVGDGGGDYYDPVESQTALKNETWRGQINRIKTDDDNPSWIVVEVVIPMSTGGFTIREAGILDADGDLIAVGKYPATYKPVLAEGSGKDLYIRMILEIGNVSSVTLKIDPAVVLSTREYVDGSIEEHNTDPSAHGNLPYIPESKAKDFAPAGFGLGEDSARPAADLDAAVKGGLYCWTTEATNAPADAGSLLVLPCSDDNVQQVAVSSSGKMFERYYNGSVWSSWARLNRKLSAGSNIELIPDESGEGIDIGIPESPAFTGTPTAPTAEADDASTRIATTGHVRERLDMHGIGSISPYDLTARSLTADDAPNNSFSAIWTPNEAAEASSLHIPVLSNEAVFRHWHMITISIDFENVRRKTQLAIETAGLNTVAGRTCIRTSHGDNGADVWSDWTEIPTRVVGTMGHGSIMQCGCNANGTYLRFADGTQICWQVAFRVDLHPTYPACVFGNNWTFPASFSNVNCVLSMSFYRSGNTLNSDETNTINPNGYGMPFHEHANVAYSYIGFRGRGDYDTTAGNHAYVDLMMIGRWY